MYVCICTRVCVHGRMHPYMCVRVPTCVPVSTGWSNPPPQPVSYLGARLLNAFLDGDGHSLQQLQQLQLLFLEHTHTHTQATLSITAYTPHMATACNKLSLLSAHFTVQHSTILQSQHLLDNAISVESKHSIAMKNLGRAWITVQSNSPLWQQCTWKHKDENPRKQPLKA